MKKKIISMLISILFISSINVLAGNLNDPEITDVTGDAYGYLDIHSVWFFEDENEPDYLFVAMKINEPSYYKFQQTFSVFWKYKNEEYACGLNLGFGLGEHWGESSAGKYVNRAPHGGPDYYNNLEIGVYSLEDEIITWKIPKELIGDPQKDDVLTDTWSNAFRRLGFLGRIGFSRPILDAFVYTFLGNSLWDHAPDNYGEYGLNYSIQY